LKEKLSKYKNQLAAVIWCGLLFLMAVFILSVVGRAVIVQGMNERNLTAFATMAMQPQNNAAAYDAPMHDANLSPSPQSEGFRLDVQLNMWEEGHGNFELNLVGYTGQTFWVYVLIERNGVPITGIVPLPISEYFANLSMSFVEIYNYLFPDKFILVQGNYEIFWFLYTAQTGHVESADHGGGIAQDIILALPQGMSLVTFIVGGVVWHQMPVVNGTILIKEGNP